MADGHSHQIHPNRVAEYNGEAEQRPRQIRCQEVEDAEKVHAYEWIASGPHVHQHNRERLPQKQQINEERKANHQRPAEYEHHHEIGTFATERALLQHTAISIGERHIK